MKRIAFLGLGIMGGPMAANLVGAGHDVVGFNRSPAAVERLVAAGGRRARSVSEAVRDAEAVITMVPDSPDVEGLALGEDGIYANAAEGAIHIEMSTVAPATAVRMHAAGRDAGVRVLDAPVSGGDVGAQQGTLSIMVGAAEDDFAAARPLLEVLGSTVVRVGPPGAGQTVKAANQLITAGTLELIAEALVFLRVSGVDPEVAVPVLAGGLAGSAVLDRKGPSMLAGEFAPGFRVDLHHKDLGILLEAARAQGVAVPLTAVVAQLVGALRAQGDGDLDHSALLRGVQRLSGVEVSGD